MNRSVINHKNQPNIAKTFISGAVAQSTPS